MEKSKSPRRKIYLQINNCPVTNRRKNKLFNISPLSPTTMCYTFNHCHDFTKSPWVMMFLIGSTIGSWNCCNKLFSSNICPIIWS